MNGAASPGSRVSSVLRASASSTRPSGREPGDRVPGDRHRRSGSQRGRHLLPSLGELGNRREVAVHYERVGEKHARQPGAVRVAARFISRDGSAECVERTLVFAGAPQQLAVEEQVIGSELQLGWQSHQPVADLPRRHPHELAAGRDERFERLIEAAGRDPVIDGVWSPARCRKPCRRPGVQRRPLLGSPELIQVLQQEGPEQGVIRTVARRMRSQEEAPGLCRVEESERQAERGGELRGQRGHDARVDQRRARLGVKPLEHLLGQECKQLGPGDRAGGGR